MSHHLGKERLRQERPRAVHSSSTDSVLSRTNVVDPAVLYAFVVVTAK